MIKINQIKINKMIFQYLKISKYKSKMVAIAVADKV